MRYLTVGKIGVKWTKIGARDYTALIKRVHEGNAKKKTPKYRKIARAVGTVKTFWWKLS